MGKASPDILPKNNNIQALLKKSLITLIYFLSGFILSSVNLGQAFTPFGIALIAASPYNMILAAMLGSSLGYIVFAGSATYSFYIAAVISAGLLKWSFKGYNILNQKRFFNPLLCFIGFVASRFFIYIALPISRESIILLLTEGVVAAGGCYFIQNTANLLSDVGQRTTPTIEQFMSLCFTGSIILSAFLGFQLNGFSPVRVIIAVIIMLAGRLGKQTSGSILGGCAGLIIALVTGNFLYGMAFAFGGMLCGIFGYYGKPGTVLAFLSVSVLAILTNLHQNGIMAFLFELLTAGIIFLIMPSSFFLWASSFFDNSANEREHFSSSYKRFISMKLKKVSGVLSDTSDKFKSISGKLNQKWKKDISSVMAEVAEEICDPCQGKFRCWITDYNNTADHFNNITSALKKDGSITSRTAPTLFVNKCPNSDNFLEKANIKYRQFLGERDLKRKENELSSITTHQLNIFSELLYEISQDFDINEKIIFTFSDDIAAAAKSLGINCEFCICTRDNRGRLRVDLTANNLNSTKLNKGELLEEINSICGRTFQKPMIYPSDNLVQITFKEKPRYNVDIGASQIKRSGNNLCGDSYQYFTDENDNIWLLVCDGMGSGGMAAVDSSLMTSFMTRLLSSGVDPQSALKIANIALIVRSGEESFATVDLGCFDLYGGRHDFYKAGGAKSYLLKNQKLFEIEAASLPAGIIEEIKFEKQSVRLSAGDIVVIISDGALCNDDSYIGDIMRSFEGNAQELASLIGNEAKKRYGSSNNDDITVLVMKIYENI